jgi:hypothetical protein
MAMTIAAQRRRSGAPTEVTVPADGRFLAVACTAVRAALVDSGCDEGCERDLQLAIDELGSVLIESSRPSGALRLVVTEDELDVYVRMVVPVSDGGFRPRVADLTRMLLDTTVGSYEVRQYGSELVGVLQRTLGEPEPGGPGSFTPD